MKPLLMAFLLLLCLKSLADSSQVSRTLREMNNPDSITILIAAHRGGYETDVATMRAGADSISAARGVLERVGGTNTTAHIVLGTLPKIDGRDAYEYEATNGTLTVRGSSAVAMCRGTYDYLRANNLGTVGWAGPRLDLPAQWPDAPLTQGETPFKLRHCYNSVTFAYTTPYWTWSRWEQELDWLAMHGYNMILAPVASEAIFTRVWKDLGLTQAEIDVYQTGPAHLPFHRMGCIRDVGGTLGENWHNDQIALQKQLLARMRELGIEPVVQGFAGFVPPAIERIYPDITLYDTMWNGGFPTSQRPVVMLPDDPLFAEITRRYTTAWSNEFGEAQYYLVDSFNEMKKPPGDLDDLLPVYGQKTYEALTAADPDAIWVLQGWMFNYQRDIWTQSRVQALMDAVPDDERLLVLDYANDYNPNWDDFQAFHGKTWVMGYVPNMGGKTAYTGKMEFYANQVEHTLQHLGKGNLAGFTLSGEGLENNEVLYELLSDTAWSSNAINLDQWLPDYAENRYGNNSVTLSSAWLQLRSSVYSSFTPHPSFGWQKRSLGRGSVYSNMDFVHAVQTFLSATNGMAGNTNYRDDATEMAALVLGLRAEEWFALADAAYSARSLEFSQMAGDTAIDLLLQADRLLESHSLHRLDRWIDMARTHSGTPTEKNEYERNARQIITVWGPPVNDYSCRVWSGLIRDFYAPRMRAIFDARQAGQSFDRTAWEAAWVNAKGISTIVPYANPAGKAAELVANAYANPLPEIPLVPVAGTIIQPTAVVSEEEP